MRLNCGTGRNPVNSLHRGLMRDGKLIKEKGQLICYILSGMDLLERRADIGVEKAFDDKIVW